MLTAARQLCAQLLHLLTQKQAAFFALPAGIPPKMCFTQFDKGHKTIFLQPWEGISRCRESVRQRPPLWQFHRPWFTNWKFPGTTAQPRWLFRYQGDSTSHLKVAQRADEEL